MRLLKSGFLGLMLLAVGASSAFAQKAVFDFENFAQGTPTPFTDTDPTTGLTATFAVNTDPAGFIIDGQQPFATLPGNKVFENQEGGKQFGILTISFSKPINDFFLNFALNDPGATLGGQDVLNLIASSGGVQVGQSTGSAQLLPGDAGGYPQGTLTYDATAFDSISLSTPINLFAIDNVSVETVVPEPGTISLWMLGVGCVCFGAWRRSRNQLLCPSTQQNS